MQRNDDSTGSGYNFDLEFDDEVAGGLESPALKREMRRNIVENLNRLVVNIDGVQAAEDRDGDREALKAWATKLVIDVLEMAEDYPWVIKFLVRSRVFDNTQSEYELAEREISIKRIEIQQKSYTAETRVDVLNALVNILAEINQSQENDIDQYNARMFDAVQGIFTHRRELLEGEARDHWSSPAYVLYLTRNERVTGNDFSMLSQERQDEVLAGLRRQHLERIAREFSSAFIKDFFKGIEPAALENFRYRLSTENLHTLEGILRRALQTETQRTILLAGNLQVQDERLIAAVDTRRRKVRSQGEELLRELLKMDRDIRYNMPSEYREIDEGVWGACFASVDPAYRDEQTDNNLAYLAACNKHSDTNYKYLRDCCDAEIDRRNREGISAVVQHERNSQLRVGIWGECLQLLELFKKALTKAREAWQDHEETYSKENQDLSFWQRSCKKHGYFLWSESSKKIHDEDNYAIAVYQNLVEEALSGRTKGFLHNLEQEQIRIGRHSDGAHSIVSRYVRTIKNKDQYKQLRDSILEEEIHQALIVRNNQLCLRAETAEQQLENSERQCEVLQSELEQANARAEQANAQVEQANARLEKSNKDHAIELARLKRENDEKFARAMKKLDGKRESLRSENNPDKNVITNDSKSLSDEEGSASGSGTGWVLDSLSGPARDQKDGGEGFSSDAGNSHTTSRSTI